MSYHDEFDDRSVYPTTPQIIKLNVLRTCANCEYNDGAVYTSIPPKRKCTIDGEFHNGDYVCKFEFVPLKKAEWTLKRKFESIGSIEYGAYQCSNCGYEKNYCLEWDDEKDNYCSNCGADMRGNKNEEKL